MDEPGILIVIVNWNHGDYLLECLDALQNQSYSAYQIMLVDNGSTDGSREWVQEIYSDVQLLTIPENVGFSRAFNWAVRSTSKPFVLSLNPDVVASPNFISDLVDSIRQDERIGIAAPKLLNTDEPSLLDSTGLFINRKRGTYDRGQGEYDTGQYDGKLEVFGACGAAALYRRSMLEDVAIDGEYFDEDFFAYYEDADLSWRARLKGWRAIYAPKAVATHVRGWGDTLRKQRRKDANGPRLALRNRYLMTVKNDSFSTFIYDLPVILFADLPRLFYMAFVCPRALLGLFDLVRLFPSAWRKRRHIQRNRAVNKDVLRLC
jgi:GT2 family glycosyltransferase